MLPEPCGVVEPATIGVPSSKELRAEDRFLFFLLLFAEHFSEVDEAKKVCLDYGQPVTIKAD